LDNLQLSNAFNERGYAYAHLNDSQKAIADFNQALKLNDQNVAAFKNRGNTYLSIGDIPSAIEDFNRALALRQGGDTETLIQRGQAFAVQHDYSKALADFNQAIKLNPESDTAFYQRGCAYADLAGQGGSGDTGYQRAIEDFSQA